MLYTNTAFVRATGVHCKSQSKPSFWGAFTASATQPGVVELGEACGAHVQVGCQAGGYWQVALVGRGPCAALGGRERVMRPQQPLIRLLP